MSYYHNAIKNEPEITETVKSVAESTGADVLGLEHRVKTKESYLGKIGRDYSEGKTGYEINDIIRYTYGSGTDTLVDKTLLCIDNFGSRGYNTIKIRKYWLDKNNLYNGINTIVQAPNGQKFAIQYHTLESFELKNGELHKLYEEQRTIVDETSERYLELEDKMYELSEKLTVSTGIKKVK